MALACRRGLLATAGRSTAGRLADASPVSSKMRRTIRTVESISLSPSLFHCPLTPAAYNRGANAKFPAERFHELTLSWNLTDHGACALRGFFAPAEHSGRGPC